MPGELESRLESALAALPPADEHVRGRARRAALDALPRRRRGRVRLLALAAAALTLLVLGAAALAAIGTIHVELAPRRERAPAVAARLAPPAGAAGISVVADGRLWLAARGARIEGLPVRAAELSPNAVYVALGIGRSLVVTAPDGPRAWTLRTPGEVRAIAWSPDTLRLAYVAGRELRIVEGDGDHDRRLDSDVRPVRPSWRADSLALAYVGSGGRAVLYDFSHDSRRVVSPLHAVFATPSFPCGAIGPLHAIAFAPAGRALVGASSDAVVFAAGRKAVCAPYEAKVHPTSIAWLGPNEVAVGERVDGPPWTSRIWLVGVRGARLAQTGIVWSPTAVLALARTRAGLLVARREGRGIVLQEVSGELVGARVGGAVRWRLPRGAALSLGVR